MHFTLSYNCLKGILTIIMNRAVEATTLSQVAKKVMVISLIVESKVVDIQMAKIIIKKTKKRLINVINFNVIIVINLVKLKSIVG